jgi:hypothetical protein
MPKIFHNDKVLLNSALKNKFLFLQDYLTNEMPQKAIDILFFKSKIGIAHPWSTFCVNPS